MKGLPWRSLSPSLPPECFSIVHHLSPPPHLPSPPPQLHLALYCLPSNSLSSFQPVPYPSLYLPTAYHTLTAQCAYPPLSGRLIAAHGRLAGWPCPALPGIHAAAQLIRLACLATETSAILITKWCILIPLTQSDCGKLSLFMCMRMCMHLAMQLQQICGFCSLLPGNSYSLTDTLTIGSIITYLSRAKTFLIHIWSVQLVLIGNISSDNRHSHTGANTLKRLQVSLSGLSVFAT